MSFAVLRTPVKVKPIKPVKKGKRGMSLEEFLQKLTATTEWFNWKINSDGAIRGKLIVEKAGKEGVEYCPITAVGYLQSGLSFPDFHYARAARKIGLPEETMHLVISAADRESVINRLHNDLRKKLLSALNLTGKRRRRSSLNKHK